MAWNVVQAFVLFGSSALAFGVGVTAFARQALPGRAWLGWLQFAIAFWCLTSGLNALLAGICPGLYAPSRIAAPVAGLADSCGDGQPGIQQ